jgi:peptidoglycan/LPS O-acetylase OafA/YrhL
LAYEEQFYIVVGLLLWAVPRHFFAGGVGVSVAVVAIALAARASGVSIDGFFFDGLWLQFWFGMVLFYAVYYGSSRVRTGALLLFVGAAALSAAEPSRLLETEKNLQQAYFVAAVFAAVALLLHRFDAAILRARWLRPIQLCGLMCYSLYLIHLPLVKLVHVGFLSAQLRPNPLVSLAVCVPLSLMVGWFFHVTVERRFMNTPEPVRRDSPVEAAFVRSESLGPT